MVGNQIELFLLEGPQKNIGASLGAAAVARAHVLHALLPDPDPAGEQGGWPDDGARAAGAQLKLGAVTEQDQLADSPDAIVVVEPSVGSVARSKGNLYLLVTSRTTGNRAREATRMIADTIRNEYYYDESAGIRQCLTKVMGVANKRLAHQRDRYGMGHRATTAGRSASPWPSSGAASCTWPRSARRRPT